MEILKFVVIVALGLTVFFIGTAFFANTATFWLAEKFSARLQNKRLKKLEKLLPGENCGECGCENCSAYAAAVFYEGMPTDKCTRGKEGLSQAMDREMAEFLQMLESDVTIDQLKKENKNR